MENPAHQVGEALAGRVAYRQVRRSIESMDEWKSILADQPPGGRDALTAAILGAAIAVHRELGPGMLESAYEACLAYELESRGLRVDRQRPLPVVYRGVRLECGYRLDLVVEDQVIVEIKAVDKLQSVHEAQMLSYLKLSGHRVGLLVNFHTRLLKDGLRRMVL